MGEADMSSRTRARFSNIACTEQITIYSRGSSVIILYLSLRFVAQGLKYRRCNVLDHSEYPALARQHYP